MDHFLWARNPLKKYAPTGHQGYIIDTVKGCWFEVQVYHQARKPDLHKIMLIAGTGDKQQDYHSADRASRWYNSILIARKIKEVDINVELISYVNDNTPDPAGLESMEPLPAEDQNPETFTGHPDEGGVSDSEAQSNSKQAPVISLNR